MVSGWATSIPSYNPADIVANLRCLMAGEEMEPMTPWYRGWVGTVQQNSEHQFKFSGIIKQINDTQVEITELPIKVWTQAYKEKLEDWIKNPGKKNPAIKDYVDYNSPSKVHFIITMESEAAMQKALEEGLEAHFKLTTTVATTNLVAFDPSCKINKYDNVADIMREFYLVRLEKYQQRKEHLLVDLTAELEKLSNQARFIDMIIKKELVVGGRKRKDLVVELTKLGFKTFSKKKEAEMAGELEPSLDDNDAEEVEEADESVKKEEKIGDGYNYLLGVSIL